METRLNDNEVKEVARMQKMIDSYEGFLRACYMMAKSGSRINYPMFDGTEYYEEMNFIWRIIRDNCVKQ